MIGIQTDNDHAATKPTLHTVLRGGKRGGRRRNCIRGRRNHPCSTASADIQNRVAEINNSKILSRPEQDQARAALFSRVLKFVVTPKGAAPAQRQQRCRLYPGGRYPLGRPGRQAQRHGARIGFNVAAQSIAPGSPARAKSLSPLVRRARAPTWTTPRLWGELQFEPNAQESRPGLLFSPRLGATQACD